MDTQLSPTIDDFFSDPEIFEPRISPCGRFISYIGPYEGKLALWVGLLNDQIRLINCDPKLRLNQVVDYMWLNDSNKIIYLKDNDGDENWHLFSLNLDNNEILDLTPFGEVQVNIIQYNFEYFNKLMIEINLENKNTHDLYCLDLDTNELRMVMKNSGQIAGWLIGYDLTVKGFVETTVDGGTRIIVIDDSGVYKELIKWSFEDSMTSFPLGFSRNGESIYVVSSQNANCGRLIEININSRQYFTVFEDDTSDVEEVLIDNRSNEIQAVSVIKERKEWVVLDNSLIYDFKFISEFRNADVNIVDRDRSDIQWIISYKSDVKPIQYYLYNRVSRTLTFLFSERPTLDRISLSPMHPIQFKARDGLDIRGYLTFPPNKKPKLLPMVVIVHGGPWHRDTWGFDSEIQFLASKGYACLQVNYRGSSGYGKNFLNAGNKEWGGKMQNDLYDAVQWAIDRGYADAQRIAVMGGSYGGYAALMAAIEDPCMFCCAVDIVGPSNLLTLLESIPEHWDPMRFMLYGRIGDYQKDKVFLESRSPIFHVDKINIPLFIVHGCNDPRVKVEESERIIEELEQRKVPYEYLIFNDEGHRFYKKENKIQLYKKLDQFLSKYL